MHTLIYIATIGWLAFYAHMVLKMLWFISKFHPLIKPKLQPIPIVITTVAVISLGIQLIKDFL